MASAWVILGYVHADIGCEIWGKAALSFFVSQDCGRLMDVVGACGFGIVFWIGRRLAGVVCFRVVLWIIVFLGEVLCASRVGRLIC